MKKKITEEFCFVLNVFNTTKKTLVINTGWKEEKTKDAK